MNRTPTHSTMRRFTWFWMVFGAAIQLASTQAASLLLKQGIVHTAAGPVLTNASVFSRDGRIVAVGSDIQEAADATIELNGAHVFPGLIATLSILGLVEIEAVRATVDSVEVGSYTPDVFAWLSVNPDSELIPVARANGYTHAQVTPHGGVLSGHSGVVALNGWTIEDMVVLRSSGMHLFWPSFGIDTTPRDRAANKDQWKSVEDQIKERDRKIREITGFFDDGEAYARAKGAADATSFRTVPAWEGLLPVLRGEVPLFLHADEYRQIQSAIDWVAARKYRAVLAGGRDAWRLTSLLSTNSIPVAFEHVFTLPVRDIDPYDVHFSAPGILVKAGVRVAVSGSQERFDAFNIRNLPYAAAQAMAFGLSREDALKGLTLEPARLLGLGDRLGSIEVGKEASMFIADGDILDIRTQVKRMWIAGKEVPLASKHTRLYERYRARPKP